jgi:phosphoserine phosphatase
VFPPFRTFLFDCDSTLSRVEGIDEIARGRKDVAALTKAAMDGTVPLDQVYGRRLELVRPSRADLARVAELYVAHATEDAAAVFAALHALGKVVHIVSGGLRPALVPLSEKLGIAPGRLHCVAVKFDGAGAYAGFAESSPLARRGGKAEVARELVGHGGRPAVMVGDGITDLEAKPEVDLFIGYGGVEDRPAVRAGSPVFIRCESLAPVLAVCLTPDEKRTLAADPAGAHLLQKAESLAASDRVLRPDRPI